MSSPSAWYRVALGMQMVAKSATESTTSNAGRLALRVGHHFVDIIATNRQRLMEEKQQFSYENDVPHGPLPVQPSLTTSPRASTPSTPLAPPSPSSWEAKSTINDSAKHQQGLDTVADRVATSAQAVEAGPLHQEGFQEAATFQPSIANSTVTGNNHHQQKHQQTHEPTNTLGKEAPTTETDSSPFGSSSDQSAPIDNVQSKVDMAATTYNSVLKSQESSRVVTSKNEPMTEEESPMVSEENQILSSNATTDDSSQSTDTRRLREGRAVPSTRIGRAWGFAQLGVGLAMGAAVEGVSRVFGGGKRGQDGSTTSTSLLVNDSNSDRLAASLCRMRGAALKMGQMLSIQDESLLPPALSRALQQVRQGAEAMPRRQLLRQMESQLGPDWRHLFVSFDELPFAAASIGQVHRATIPDPTGTQPRQVVVKVQYPGVARSIESDLRNLSMLVTMTGLSPKGLFIENVIRVGQEELKVECDYVRELKNQRKIKELVASDPMLVSNRFVVPDAFPSHSTSEVLTSEYISGGTIDKVSNMDQEERNRVGRAILYLTMKELFEWRFMQTDPNWGNFLYDVSSRTTGLVDFGAAREYSKEFVDGYIRIVWASANRDVETLMDQSRRMKFLTGDENEEMLQAHKMSAFTVGEPFWGEGNKPFDFRGSNISTRMGQHTAVFLRHRRTPPPEEVYTLHRKLAGAYMLCIKLGSIVESRSILKDFVREHTFDDGLPHPITADTEPTN
ncbi:hypothetical protein ACA910_021892 [Epithemia clementina (nom. ined.)]